MATKALSVSQAKQLAECESTIEQHKDSWFKAGMALAMVRDERLYRDTHKTFAEYIRERWQMGPQFAYRLIDASEVAAISPVGDIIPSERVARELAGVEAEAHEAVLAVASENGKAPTASGVRALLDRVVPQNGTAKLKPKRISTKGDIPKTNEAGRPKKPKITAEQVREATRKLRSGKEVVTPAMRKIAFGLYGKLVRAMDRMGIPTKESNPHLNAIHNLLKNAK